MLRHLGMALIACASLSSCAADREPEPLLPPPPPPPLQPLCTDQVRNGDETDVDCGGSCRPCELGDSCSLPADCEDGTCSDGTCAVPPCGNGVQDAGESDVDCGGTCQACTGGRSCRAASDCASGVCEPATSTCAVFAMVAFDAIRYPTGDKPYAVFSGDLDGDGDGDLAVTNELESTISVFVNDGAGAFAQPARKFATGTYPTGGAIIDLNRDRAADVVTADYRGHGVSVLLNAGTATLAARTSYPTVPGAETSNLAVGDLDEDGNPDVIATNPQNASISVFLARSDGTLAPAIHLPVGSSGTAEPYSVAITDFNGDRHNDVAIADSRTRTFVVRLGNGDGTFQPETGYAIRGTAPFIMASHDINTDRTPDLVSANRGSDDVSVLLGRGDGTFHDAIVSTTGPMTRPYSVAVADFNLDGLPDVVTGDYTVTASSGDPDSIAASVLLGRGDGRFQPPLLVRGLISYGVAVGDFNADHKPDFALANFEVDQVTVMLNASR